MPVSSESDDWFAVARIRVRVTVTVTTGKLEMSRCLGRTGKPGPAASGRGSGLGPTVVATLTQAGEPPPRSTLTLKPGWYRVSALFRATRLCSWGRVPRKARFPSARL
jgi:hypothetical protein